VSPKLAMQSAPASAAGAMATPEELLAGSELTYDVEIPAALLRPSLDGDHAADLGARQVRIRPLTVRDVQLIARAAKNDEVLTSILMVQRAVVAPPLKDRDVGQMHGGLVQFLVERINRVSGLSTDDDELRSIADSPLVQAFVIMAKEFGWTPEQVKALTMAQLLGYLEVLGRRGDA
jgi:ABC-type nitrate/sulfonate/bicarbonate transport system substrate-binding protein